MHSNQYNKRFYNKTLFDNLSYSVKIHVLVFPQIMRMFYGFVKLHTIIMGISVLLLSCEQFDVLTHHQLQGSTATEHSLDETAAMKSFYCRHSMLNNDRIIDACNIQKTGSTQRHYDVQGGPKSKPDCYCNNFDYCQPASIIFGTQAYIL